MENAASPEKSEKVVPITREYPHYLEPGSYALMRKMKQGGSGNGSYSDT